MANSPFNITWTCHDGTTIDLTAQDIIQIPIAVAQRSNGLHIIARELKAAAYAAQAEADLDLIVWPTE
jgi:hypothetical protein